MPTGVVFAMVVITMVAIVANAAQHNWVITSILLVLMLPTLYKGST